MDEINIKDILGRIIYTERSNGKNASLMIEQEGLYFVTIKIGQQTLTRKLIVKH